jgi:integrase
VRTALPALLTWTPACDHLRDVTRGDVVSYLAGLHGRDRYQTVTALPSLFTWAKKQGVVFRNPATRIRLGRRDLPVWQPLTAADLAAAAAATARSPQARACMVLAAVHAVRPGAIRALQLDDVDVAARRLRLAGTSRPMDDLTCKVLREWLDFRRQRWPGTGNPTCWSAGKAPCTTGR